MQQYRKGTSGAVSTHGRTIKVAPVTKAIRVALAASATAFALAGSGAAFAQSCEPPVDGRVLCDGAFTAPVVLAPVEDLTLVLGENAPTSVTVSGQPLGAAIAGNGTLGISSNADIAVDNTYDAIGLYVASGDGPATVANDGGVAVTSTYGSGVAIYAAGTDTQVDNAGTLQASAYYWTAGIETEAAGTATIANSGDIGVAASAYNTSYALYGHATGIEAIGGEGAVVDNSGNILADGTFAKGIYAYAAGTGGVDIGNSGSITALAYTGYAAGIAATTTVADSDIAIDNSGAIFAVGFNGASGIDAIASGEGASAAVSNTGDVYALGYLYASGIVVSGDGGASVDNAAAIDVGVYAGYGSGIQALAFAGDADVSNTGDIAVRAAGIYAPVLSGIVSSSSAGAASADNAGSIVVDGGLYYANGMVVSAYGDAVASNSGTISVASLYGVYGVFGIQAQSTAGDVSVANAEGGGISAHSGYGAGFGLFGIAAAGDVSVDNAGGVSAYGVSQGAGIFARAEQGSANVANSGEVFADSGAYGLAVGAFARADYGTAGIVSSGTIYAASDYIAYGALARGAEGDIDNSGYVTANGGALALGLIASTSGNAVVSNAGTVTTLSQGGSIGIYAVGAGDITVDNAGDLSAVSQYSLADGIFASGANVDVGNSGSIRATGFDWAAGIEAEAEGGSTTVVSSGDIVAVATSIYTGYYGHAYGIYATGSQVAVDNSGAIAAGGVYATGIQALATGAGAVTVANSGTIDAGGYTIYAAGIRAASAYEGASVSVDNSGSIAASSLFGSSGIEAIATGEGATASASNSGDITAYSSEYYANTSGIVVSADAGASVDNSGAIAVTYADYAYGAQALTFNGDAVVDNAGTIEVTGGFIAYGALAASTNGTGAVTSNGDIVVAATHPQGTATGIGASGNAAASVANAGSIVVGGGKYDSGIVASSPTGAVTVDNSGTIAADGKYAWGVRATSAEGDVLAENSGAIAATGSMYATGIAVASGSGTAAAVNAGDIVADGSGIASVYGIKAVTDAGGDIAIENAAGGAVDASAYGGAAFGIGALAAAGGDVGIANAGDVAATGSTYAGYYGGTYGSTGVTGIFGRADAGSVSIDNAGSASADNPYASAEAVVATAAGDAMVGNSGVISAIARGNGGAYAPTYDAAGIRAYAVGATTVVNAGQITAVSGYGAAYGIDAYAAGSVAVANSGDIHVAAGDAVGTTGASATGILAVSAGDVGVDNSGTITASPYTGDAVGVQLASGTLAQLSNSGLIEATESDGLAEGIAVLGSDGRERIVNTGELRGAIVTAGDADEVRNGAHGVWYLTGNRTSLGDGDDTIANAAGGTIHLQDGALSLGSGTGNRFDNAGTIRVSGDGLIHMGTGAPAAPAAAQPGMAAIGAQAAVPSLNTTPLVNSGVLDFVDAAPDDRLTLVGDLGGNGSVNIDVDTAAGTADQLLVDGSIADGAVQTVNVAFNGFEAGDGGGVPLDFASVAFAQVTGNAEAGSFVAGEVSGFDPGNFLDLDVLVSSQIDTSNASADVFSVGVDVAGLNDTGAIAASVGAGAWSLMTSQIGTWRQRMGVVPAPAAGENVSAFVRTFYERGDVSPEHEAFNFGQRGNFDFEQLNSGTEIGLNFEPVPGFNIGAILGKSRGKQTLHDPGIASDKLQADTLGVYGTWIGQRGWYVDASYRAMRFDARTDSAAGRQRFDGTAGAINLETGYAFELGSGLRLEPQFQYTWTTVDSVFVRGPDTWLRTDDGDWHRSRLGLSAWQAFETGAGITWTPYGALSVVRVDDAKTGYSIGDTFRGNTSAAGTSALVELGVGMHWNGLSGSFGANWTDGGALDSFVGGQLVLRYGW